MHAANLRAAPGPFSLHGINSWAFSFENAPAFYPGGTAICVALAKHGQFPTLAL